MHAATAHRGVSSLAIDTESLANGLFRLLECRGVMPDGLTFQMPDSDRLPPSREVADFFPPGKKELDVYLAIPEQRIEAPNVKIPISAEDGERLAETRYTAETRAVADQNAGLERKDVQIARRNFRLLFDTEFRDGFSMLRIAQVTRNAAGQCIVKKDFIAPCLEIAHSEYLMGLIRRQIEILATKSATLSASRSERGKDLAGFSPSEVESFWLLHTVNSYLPELRHIWKVRHGHPEQAYVAMLRLAGALSTFTLSSRPEDLPDYDHDDLGVCFTALDERIRDLMETVIRSKYLTIPLNPGPRQVWSGVVPDDRYFRNSQFFLSISAAMDIGELIQKVPRSVKIASPDEIDRLIDKALSGISLTHTQQPPAAPVRLHQHYFTLSQVGDLWKNVVLSRNLAVYAPIEIKSPKMEILVVLE